MELRWAAVIGPITTGEWVSDVLDWAAGEGVGAIGI